MPAIFFAFFLEFIFLVWYNIDKIFIKGGKSCYFMKENKKNKILSLLRGLLVAVLVFIIVSLIQRIDVFKVKYQQSNIKDKVSTFEFDDKDNLDISDQVDPLMENPINFDDLWAINPQATRWLYVPNTAFNNYVIEEKQFGYNYYLYRDVYGNKNNVGSFFVPKLKTDNNATLNIYAHNFHDGFNEVAFNSLNYVYENEKEASSRKYAYIYTKYKTYKYELVMASDILNTDVPYIDTGYELNTDLYQEVIDHLKSHARFIVGDMDNSDEGLILTTCSAPTDYQPERLAVVFKLIDVKENKNVE